MLEGRRMGTLNRRKVVDQLFRSRGAPRPSWRASRSFAQRFDTVRAVSSVEAEREAPQRSRRQPVRRSTGGCQTAAQVVPSPLAGMINRVLSGCSSASGGRRRPTRQINWSLARFRRSSAGLAADQRPAEPPRGHFQLSPPVHARSRPNKVWRSPQSTLFANSTTAATIRLPARLLQCGIPEQTKSSRRQ